MPSNAIILQRAPIACVLAGNDIAKGAMFGARLDPMLPAKIYATYTVIKKVYDADQNYAGMTARCLYLWELMDKYGIRAAAFTGGGGSIAPITPSSVIPIPDFYVDGSSYIVTGQSIKVIDTYLGLGLIFIRNNVPQSTANSGGGESYYSWDEDTATFMCVPEAQAGELFQLRPTV